MAQPYNYELFSRLRQQVSNRLYDSSQKFWSDAEVGLYVVEALRTWNALTSMWRGDFVFPTQTGVRFYDLPTVANTLRPYTVTLDPLYNAIQYHLLEPANSAAVPWIGSTQFTQDDLINAISRRRDEVLSITGCTYTRTLVPATIGRTLLPATVIDVRRVAYIPGINTGYGVGLYGAGPYGVSPSLAFNLWPEDAWAEQSFNRRYTLQPPGNPSTYLMSTQPPISFDTDRPPGSGGQYEVLTISTIGPASDASNVTLPWLIPDDWTHLLKWGALADLLSRDSNASDPARAQYCEQRYRMGLKLLTSAPALLAMRNANNSLSLQVDSIRELDLYDRSWQSRVAGSPVGIGYAGLNLVAVIPAPDSGPYSLQATVVQNAPIPVLDNDAVQVARDDLDVIIDYAQHLAAFKQGGAEFTATIPLLNHFLQQATLYGLKLSELGEFTSMLLGLASGEEQNNPRTTVETTT